MIIVIYGAKGTGKTKMMIDAANETVSVAKGHMIFITDSKRGMYDLEREVRFIDTSDYDIAGEAALCGFVKGVIAGNHDNEYVYIDGVCRITGKPVAELAAFFYMLDKKVQTFNATFNRRNNVASKYFRQIVEQTAQKCVDNTFIASVKLNCAEVTHNSYEKYVPHNGSFRYARRLCPTFLETQLTNKINELATLAFKCQLLHTS